MMKRRWLLFYFVSVFLGTFCFSLLYGMEYIGTEKSTLNIFDDSKKMGKACARNIVDLICRNNALNRPTVLGFATGSTPIPLYKAFIEIVKNEEIDLSLVVTFNLDEYCGLPKDHPQSYHSFMFSYLFESLLWSSTNPKGIRLENIHIPNGYAKQLTDLSKKELISLMKQYPMRPKTSFLREEEENWVLNQRAMEYDLLIRKNGPIHLQIVGIGENGHIGFAEPGSSLTGRTAVVNLTENTRKNNARFFDHQIENVPSHAITMGIGTIKDAEEIYLLASGKNKANIIKKAVEDPMNSNIPATALQSHPHTSIFLDTEAAAELSESSIFCYHNARILKNHAIAEGDVWITNGKIIPQQEKADYTIDVHGMILAPGYIDLQINGGFGVDFSVDPHRVQEVADRLPQNGVTSFLPTIITVNKESYRYLISQLQPRKFVQGATILGVHLEGPFLSPEKNGAHNKELILPLEYSLEECYGDLNGVKLVTLAPEIPGALKAINFLKSLGIVVSAGHSKATYDEMRNAVHAGVSVATHLFNAMSPLNHRTPGIVEAVLTSDTMAYSIIADGVHVHPAMIHLAWKTHPKGLFLVTDAIEALGLPMGVYHLGNMKVEVNHEAAYILGTKTIAGSVLSMDKAVQFFRKSTECSLVDALEAASLKPAQVLGIQESKGHLNEGADADFNLLDDNLDVQACVISGRLAWEK